MVNVINEILSIIWMTFKSFGIEMIKFLYNLSGLPTTRYGLVQFICDKNLVFFNNEILTSVLLWIAPLLVSHIIVYFCDKFKIRNIKDKEILSIILYVLILYLFSSWIFWTIVGVICFIVGIIYFYNRNKPLMD